MKILKLLVIITFSLAIALSCSCTTTKHFPRTWDGVDCHPNDRNQRR